MASGACVSVPFLASKSATELSISLLIDCQVVQDIEGVLFQPFIMCESFSTVVDPFTGYVMPPSDRDDVTIEAMLNDNCDVKTIKRVLPTISHSTLYYKRGKWLNFGTVKKT